MVCNRAGILRTVFAQATEKEDILYKQTRQVTRKPKCKARSSVSRLNASCFALRAMSLLKNENQE